MKVVFMGTPEFAVPTLQKLINSEHDVIAVYTQPPKPKGRKYIETPSPVQIEAEKNNIPVKHPKSLKNRDIQEEFRNLNADIAVVAAYGLLLPPEILYSCKYGCINIHPSLLPKYRGAAPIQRAILAGDKETAVCIMKMDEGFDTGDILLQQKVAIDQNTYFLELHDKLAELGAKLILDTLKDIDNIKPIKQKDDGIIYANKIEKKEGLIDWNKPAEQIYNQIRALNPWPGTYFTINNDLVKILKATFVNQRTNYNPGIIINEKFHISCGSGILIPEIIQRSGKKQASIKEFLKGFKVEIPYKLL